MQADGAGRRRLAQPEAELPAGTSPAASRTCRSSAPQHRRPGVDVLGDRVLHEALGRDDRQSLSASTTPQHAAEVIDVGVGVDDRGDGTVASVRRYSASAAAARLRRDQRVDHDHAWSPSTKVMFERSQPADLVDAGRDLVEALLGAQLRLAPQARVRGVGHRRRGRPSALSQTTRPSAAVITMGSSEPINPRSESLEVVGGRRSRQLRLGTCVDAPVRMAIVGGPKPVPLPLATIRTV